MFHIPENQLKIRSSRHDQTGGIGLPGYNPTANDSVQPTSALDTAGLRHVVDSAGNTKAAALSVLEAGRLEAQRRARMSETISQPSYRHFKFNFIAGTGSYTMGRSVKASENLYLNAESLRNQQFKDRFPTKSSWENDHQFVPAGLGYGNKHNNHLHYTSQSAPPREAPFPEPKSAANTAVASSGSATAARPATAPEASSSTQPPFPTGVVLPRDYVMRKDPGSIYEPRILTGAALGYGNANKNYNYYMYARTDWMKGPSPAVLTASTMRTAGIVTNAPHPHSRTANILQWT